jgi:hypothetical protein
LENVHLHIILYPAGPDFGAGRLQAAVAEKGKVIGYYKGHVNHLKNMQRIVLLRHGESVWNRENRFTGWTDPGLTGAGCEGARAAGRRLGAADFCFDEARTSSLKPAIKTLVRELDAALRPKRHDHPGQPAAAAPGAQS